MKRAIAAPAFRKMRLVPIDVQDKHVLEEQIRSYDPLVSTMADLVPQIKKPRVKRGDHTAALAVQNASLQHYKALERQRAVGQSMPAIPPPSVPDGEPTGAVESLPDIDVPRMFRPKVDRLLAELAKHPGVISRSGADELVLDGVVQRGTTFTGAMRSLYVNSAKPAPGTRQLAERLRKLKVNRNMLSSKFALSLCKQSGSGIKWPGKASRILHVYK